MLDDMVSYGKVSNLKPVQRILLTWCVSNDPLMVGSFCSWMIRVKEGFKA